MKILILHRGVSYSRDKIISEAQNRNHHIDSAEYADLRIEYQDDLNIYTAAGSNILEYDCIIPRGPLEYRHILQMISLHAQKNHIIVLNQETLSHFPIYDKSIQYYLLATNHLPIIPSALDYEKHNFADIVKTYGQPFIYKYTKGFAGGHVYRIQDEDNFKKIPDYQKILSERYFLIQKYWPAGSDYRIIVVGNKVIGGMKRTAASKEEYRNNYSLGGNISAVEVDLDIEKIALDACRVTKCDYAGVDIMYWQDRPYILEVNRYCHFEGFDQVHQDSVATKIIEYLEQLYDQKKSS